MQKDIKKADELIKKQMELNQQLENRIEKIQENNNEMRKKNEEKMNSLINELESKNKEIIELSKKSENFERKLFFEQASNQGNSNLENKVKELEMKIDTLQKELKIEKGNKISKINILKNKLYKCYIYESLFNK